ncbi:MAG TPA: carboxypeptidase-like regulatory domain-containing protein, partial [Verrucomicrobiae bacterium]|nr:carboxypeptidase-like regulatory domain-containing protein [Verrucomicrobiae bacterium]
QLWTEVDDQLVYVDDGTSNPGYFRMSGLPNRLFQFNPFTGGIPSPGYTIWSYYGDSEWFSEAGSGSDTFTAYYGGPLDNIFPNNSPAQFGTYTLDLHAYSTADHSIEVPGVTVKFNKTSRPAGGKVAHDEAPYPSGATQAAGQWFYSNFPSPDVTLVDYATRLVKVSVYMTRAMVVSGVISGNAGPVPEAAVVIRNRYGNPIAQTVTGADGKYQFTTLQPQPVYLDVNRRGFRPFRKRFDPPSVSNPDITANITLENTPAPTIDKFTMNRFGLFLPGVLKSGDAHGFNTETARTNLTLTWKATARGPENYHVTLDGFVRPDETQQPPEEFDIVDRVAELWLVDRRSFTNAPANYPNQRAVSPVDPPAPLNYVSVMKWLNEITAAKKDGQPYYVVHQIMARSKANFDNNFTNKLNLWELPSGVFSPRLIAITENGGVVVKDYELPGSQVPLQGMNMPGWVAGLTTLIGYGATAGGFDVDLGKSHGEGFFRVDTISPKMEAHITLDPLSANPPDDANLIYKYVLGVELPIGEHTTSDGPMKLGPEFLGHKIEGATVEFEVTGKDRKAALGLVFNGADEGEHEEQNKGYTPEIAKEASNSIEATVEFHEQAKAGVSQTLDADWLGNNLLSGYSFILEGQATADVSLRVNATPVLKAIPYVGPVLLALDKTGALTVWGKFETTMGVKLAYEYITQYKKVSAGGTTDGTDQGARFDFMGQPSSTHKVEFKLILRLAAGLEITALRGAAEGTALLQVGAPKDANDTEGIFFTFDPVGRNPLLTQIDGAFSVVLRAAVNLWAVQYSKQWQWDVARWTINRTAQPAVTPQSVRGAAVTEEDSHMEITPIFITTTLFNPATAPPFKFVGANGTLVQDFYRPGVIDVSTGSKPLLVFTGTDPGTGLMTVMASTNSGKGWSQPVKIASAGGIVSVATVENPAGGWMVAWSEIDQADLGNPYASSTLKYSLLNTAGTAWTTPEVIHTGPEVAFNLKLAAADKQILLAYLTTIEGPLGEHQTLTSLVWNGTAWAAPKALLPPQTIKVLDVAGNTNGAAVLAASTGDGQVLSFDLVGTVWSTPTVVGTGALGPLSLSLTSASFAGLAWENTNSTVLFSTRDASAFDWSAAIPVVTNVSSPELQLTAVNHNGATLYLAAWTAGGD